MKVEVPMVDWHRRVSILSVDIHPSGRIATASQDGTIRVRHTSTPLMPSLCVSLLRS